ncbi:MAG: BamA/TamA family outer membrane protein [Bdellovibrionales bacterium]|nr:BamA/TamA family outer membrane protein [Bdellovibrionales bacterium]
MMKSVGVLLALLFSVSAFAAPPLLRELNPKDDELLKKSLPSLFNGGTPELSVLDEAIRLLMAKGTYENVFVEKRKDGVYEIIGKPVRTVEAIEFTGTRRIEESELRDLLEIKIGERFDRKRAVASAEKMKTYYGENGFFNTIIEVTFDKLPSKNMKITYAIQEKEPCIISGLDFTTENKDLHVRLEARFRDVRKRRLTTDRARRLSNDLNEFLINSRYLTAEISGPEATYNKEKTKAYLKFEVREPYRWEFFLSGFRWPETETSMLQALDLRNRERKNVDPPGEGADRLRRYYLEKGFPNVQIETKVVNPPGTFLRRVYFTINEGARVRIKAIEVQGRISRSSKYYEKFILENSSPLIARGYYNRSDLEIGFKNLVTSLRNEGYLRARVLSSRVEFNDKRDMATIVLLLEEGPQTQIRALDFEGNKFVSSFELAQVTGLETNSPLRLNQFEASLEKLREFYHNQGFLEMKLLNEKDDIIQYNDKGTQARILFRIYEGPRIRVHSIAVEGNTITKTRVILKEADFRVGEVLTLKKIDDATIRLNKLGLFSRVDIHTLEEGTNVAERTLVINVTDRDPGTFRIGPGITNERNLTVRGVAGLSYQNLGGTGRGISLRGEIKQNVAQINYPEHEFTIGYFEPFLLNTRTRGRMSLTRSEHVFDYQHEHRLTKLTTTNRLDLMAERDLSSRTRLAWKVWSLESNTDWERQGRCVVDPSDPNSGAPYNPAWGKCASDTMQVATIGPILDIDYRDNPFLPTRGSNTRLSIDYSHPSLGSSAGVKFIRTEGSYSHYFRLPWKRWIWANSVRSGYVKNLSDDPSSGVPSNYAFLLGGINTLRGFDLASDNERVPKQGDGVSDSHPNGFQLEKGNQRLIQNDSYYYLLKTELRFPIYGEHGGVVFYDGGAVGVSGYKFKRPYRDAVGVGYRYETPVGPVALDFAFKVRPEVNEELFRFHLSIGTF